ncbi:MAG: hypothetical protein K8T25_01995 [Planctomycetia bacterium]|nr:hypothetical protein [Planctomycetia bacterium]
MSIRTIMADAMTWQHRHADIVSAYVVLRSELRKLGLPPAEYEVARDLLRIVLVTSRRREVAA